MSSSGAAGEKAGEKMIVLRSSDGKIFEVNESVAAKSLTIKNATNASDGTIPLFNVTSEILTKVLAYCERHVNFAAHITADGGDNGDLTAFDADFVNVDQNTLFDLVLAADYLEIKSLYELTCLTVANIMSGKSPSELISTLGLTEDFTPEEKEKAIKEHGWAWPDQTNG